MVFKTDFHIQVDYDDCGLIVVVTHQPTGITCCARPVGGQPVQSVKDKLLLEIKNQIYDPEEFQFDIYSCGEDSKRHTVVCLIHVPTGKSRNMTEGTKEQLLDELVQELWDEGIRPKVI